MTAKRRRLAPKGADEANKAVSALSEGKRYEAEPVIDTPPPRDEAPKPKPPSKKRSDAKGMTRRTYYLTEADADVFDNAADEIHTALKGLIPRHRILGALVATGADNRAAIIENLRRELVDNLS